MKLETPVIRELLTLTAAFLEDLKVQKDLGSPGYNLSPEALAALGRWKEGAAKAAPPRPAPDNKPQVKRDSRPAEAIPRPAPSPAPVRAPVTGAGREGLKVLFVTDSPIAEQDDVGILLKKITGAMGLSEGEWKVADLNGGIEGQNGGPGLDESVIKMNPKAVCLLGEKTARAIIGGKTPFPALAGRFHDTSIGPVLPTWHPSTILACRFPEEERQVKKEVWKHMQMIMKRIGLPSSRPKI